MQCPKCGALTHVSEKRGPFRNRRCANPTCRNDFMTCENIMHLSGLERVGVKTLNNRSQAWEVLSTMHSSGR